jgi:hypothetical protein
MKFKVFWDVLPCSKYEVDIEFRTRQYISEDSELHTRRRENLKSHNPDIFTAMTILNLSLHSLKTTKLSNRQNTRM